MNHGHDSSYKRLFSHAAMVEDLLRGFVKEDWVAALDFSTLEKANNSYITDDQRERRDDVVWRVRFGGQWLYVYLLLEFQSTPEPFMAVRIMAYVALLYQDLLRGGYGAKELLPPVLPIVLYNGVPRWRAPLDVADLIVPGPGDLARYRPRLRYLLLDEGRYEPETLEPLHNLVAALFRLENSRGPEDMRHVLAALLEWLGSPEQDSLRRAFTVWLKRVLLPARVPGVDFSEMHDLQEVNTMLAERVKEWTQEWRLQGLEEGRKEGRQIGLQEGLQEGRQEGRQVGLREGRQVGLREGRQEGRQEGEAALVLRLLERKFPGLDAATRRRVEQANADTLLLWGERILLAQTLDEVFSEPGQMP